MYLRPSFWFQVSQRSRKRHKEHIPIEFGCISLILMRHQNMKMSWSEALLTYATAWSRMKILHTLCFFHVTSDRPFSGTNEYSTNWITLYIQLRRSKDVNNPKLTIKNFGAEGWTRLWGWRLVEFWGLSLVNTLRLNFDKLTIWLKKQLLWREHQPLGPLAFGNVPRIWGSTLNNTVRLKGPYNLILYIHLFKHFWKFKMEGHLNSY